MFIYAGIDEAGYGPMLGPLCVACTVFVIDDHDPDVAGPCDLWKRLSNAVCRKRTDTRKRIAVEDSKKLKGARDGALHPLKHLERGVLAFCSSIEAAESCGTCCDLLQLLGVDMSAPAAWYESISPLPVGSGSDELRIASARLRTAMANQGVRCERIGCEAIDAGAFNQQVQRMGSKASVNFCAVLRFIDAVWKRWPSEHPRVVVDRQGGRTHYRDDLMHAFPEAQIQILAETETLSRYRLEESGSKLTVSFAVEAEQAHLPVALASMTAKYVRELMMLRLNRYFQAMMPELKPTAGYVEDGRRYLQQIAPLIERNGIDRRSLVRNV